MKIYTNGNIHTMDKNNTVVTAMAVENGGIVALGEAAAALDAPREDLHGKTVIPGLIDTHAHLFMAADSEADGPMYIPESVEDLLSDLRERVRNQPTGTWISYRNTYPLRLREARYPTRAELDEIAPDHPVAIDGFYSAQLNSKALASMDLTTLPPGGRVLTDAAGVPTGTLLNCFGVLVSHYPKREQKPLGEAIREVMTCYNRMGITASIEGISRFDGIDAVHALYQAGNQTVRLRYTMMVPAQGREDLLAQIQSRQLDTSFEKIAFLKQTIDGGILTGTSLMRDPYQNIERIFSLTGMGEEWRGNLVTDVSELAEAIAFAQENKLQFGAHCVGDGAVERLLSAYERVGGTQGKRHALIHADFVDEKLLARARALDVQLLFQPAWHYMDAPLMGEIVSPREVECFQPYRKMIASGVPIAAGSDHMVKQDPRSSCNPFDPFLGLYNMVTCKARDGRAYQPEQALTRDEALICYTRSAAGVCFDECQFGSLEVGKRADFVVLDRDYFTCPEDEILKICPVQTVVDGKTVYQA